MAKQLVQQLIKEGETSDQFSSGMEKAHKIGDSEELAYLNRHYSLPSNPQSIPPSVSPWKTRAKLMLGRVVFAIFAKYLEEERDFLSNLVRLQNDLSERVDALTTEIVKLSHALNEVSKTAERAETLHRLLEDRLARPGERSAQE